MLLGYLLRSAATAPLAFSKSALARKVASYTCDTLNVADVVRLLGQAALGRADVESIQPRG